MPETVFPCHCGMLLKVYGDDQVGQAIVCPSCGSTVTVPALGIAVDATAPFVADGPSSVQAASKAGNWFGLVYLGAISIVTLGLIKFILMPALAPPPVVVARVRAAQDDETADVTRDPEPDLAPRHLLKRPRGATPTETAEAGDATPKKKARSRSPVGPTARRSVPRKARVRTPKTAFPRPPAPDDEAGKADDSETVPTGEPGVAFGGIPKLPTPGIGGGLGALPTRLRAGMGGMPGGMPSRARGGTGPAGGKPDNDDPTAPSKSSTGTGTVGSDTGETASARRLPKDDAKPRLAKKAPAKKLEFDNIKNKLAREALINAAKNTTDFFATWAAENFLRIAEKAADGDPEVLAEIKKLRHKIAVMRNEPE